MRSFSQAASNFWEFPGISRTKTEFQEFIKKNGVSGIFRNFRNLQKNGISGSSGNFRSF
jgi:hypothetical protein